MTGEEAFENIFAPTCESRRLAAGEIVAGMGLGALRHGLLLPKARKAVDAEVKRQCKKSGRVPCAGDSGWRAGPLGAARDIGRRKSGRV